MDFLKLFADMEQLFEPFTYEERGALLTAMMAYAFHGEDTEFDGNERFVWPVLRRHIDQCNAFTETMRENGAKGGRPKTKDNQKKPDETRNNQTKPEITLQEQEQEQEHIQEQEQEYEQEHEHEHVVTARAREARRFRPPTVEEVSEYCRERRNSIDPQRFVNHYSSNGWRVGKNPMKDWKAAVRTWEQNEFTSGAASRDSPANQGLLSRTEEHKSTPGFWESLEVNLDDTDEHGRLPGEPGYGT